MEARRTVRIVNRQGLHARPCHSIATTALAHLSEVRIRATNSGPEVNGKSILELMTLSASLGTEVEVRAWGPDAETLVRAVCSLIDLGFGEEI